ncbi:MAG: hypothetical protein IKB71_01120 [Lentisphaeria bacterium]|nr:hypothetical protein [Lentisphaeria bacterium]
MESAFIKEKIAAKISQLLDTEIPVNIPDIDSIDFSSGRLFYEGISYDKNKMQKSYNFRLCWYDENRNIPADKIHIVEEAFRTASPEIFSNGNNKFHVRYYNLKSANFSRVNTSGILYFCAELTFSIVF